MSRLKFIEIARGVQGEAADKSSFALYPRSPEALDVIGALPHSARWRPYTEKDRDALVEWLQSLTYAPLEPVCPIERTDECPECHGHDIEGGPVDINVQGATQECYCLNEDCGASWVLEFGLEMATVV